MGQGFLYVNKNKMEYIDSMIHSGKFDSVINNHFLLKMLNRLICTSQNSIFQTYKNKSLFSKKYMGSWSGDIIEIMGDYEQEIELREHVYKLGTNISLEVAAIIYDQDIEELNAIISKAKDSVIIFKYIVEIALLPECPNSIIHAIKENIGEDYKLTYYKLIYSK